MTAATWILVALVVVLLTAAMVWRLALSIRAMRALQARIASTGSSRERDSLEERYSDTTMRIAFDVVVLAALLWSGVWLLQKLMESVPDTGGETSLEDIVGWAQRISVVIVAFAILYGLSTAVLPKIFPNEGTRQNAWLSQLVAIGVAATVALPILVSNEMFDRLRTFIEEEFSEVVFNVLTLLALGISVYLVWAKGKVLLRPTRKAQP